MGLIKALGGATGGVLADQWKEYFYCEAIPSDVLAVKGRKKATGRSSNKHGDDNIITTVCRKTNSIHQATAGFRSRKRKTARKSG